MPASQPLSQNTTRSGRPLTPRQAAFVREYLIDHNGAQAAIRAGYAPRSAAVTAAKLLIIPNVAAAVRAGQAASAERCQISADWVLERLRGEALGEAADSTAASRVQALRTLAKCLGLERTRLEGAVDIGIRWMQAALVTREGS